MNQHKRLTKPQIAALEHIKQAGQLTVKAKTPVNEYGQVTWLIAERMWLRGLLKKIDGSVHSAVYEITPKGLALLERDKGEPARA